MPHRHIRTRGFSLLELVIVVVVIAIVAAIAITRVGAAAQNSQNAAIAADVDILNKAVDLYTTEHGGLGPTTEQDGTIDVSPDALVARLTGMSDVTGSTGGPGSVLGPYLRAIPKNPMNGLNTIQVDGPSAGTNLHGWRFDTARGTFQADDSVASASIQAVQVFGGATSVDGP